MPLEHPADAPPRSVSLMTELKRETADLHARIESVVPLMRPALDLRAYRTYLARLHQWLAPVEERLGAYAAAWACWGVDFDERRKAARLARDLRTLGADPADAIPLAPREALPGLLSLSEAWGCLYVLEGSTLGGQVILRTVGPRLGITASSGLGFLAGYGPETGAMWKAFAVAIERFAAAAGCDRAAVVRGASETFAAQMAWIASGEAVVRADV